MRVPLELSFRGLEQTEDLENLIRDKAQKLKKISDNLISCRVAVEKVQKHQRQGRPYRVRIDVRHPPGHELVVRREPGQGDLHEPLTKVIKDAFDVMFRQLRELVDREQGQVKSHPEQQLMAVVVRLFPEDGYGFIRTPDEREFFFHRNSVLHDDFDRLEIGTGVRFVGEEGEKGPQASTVEIVDKPGARASKTEDAQDIPKGWET